jgi:hypothetical protein
MNPPDLPSHPSIPESILKHLSLSQEGSCWVWTGRLDKDGYPVVQHNGRQHGGHRLVALLVSGSDGKGMDASHLCNNRSCMNPTHIVLESHSENMSRIVWTSCHKGHTYVKGSWRYDSKRRKTCLICLKNKYSKK